MAFLNLQSIKEVNDIRNDVVEVPEWGGSVRVRSMSGRMRSNLEQMANSNANFGDMRLRVITSCTLGEDGNLLFTDADRKWLNEKSGMALQRVFQKICDISGFNEDKLETAEGNSETLLS